jgi:GxxExxY protein
MNALSQRAEEQEFDPETTAVLPMRPPVDACVQVLRCAQTVHRLLGPGLEDFLYARSLALELAAARISYQRDVFVEVRYRGAIVGKRRVSFVLDDLAVEVFSSAPEEAAQLRTRAAALLLTRPVGLSLNFGPSALQASRADGRLRLSERAG